MIFVLFTFLTGICISLLAFGAYKKNVPLVAMSGVFFTLIGLILMTDGLRDEGRPIFSRSGDIVSVSGYATLTTANDFSVYIFSNLFLWGGLAIILAAFGFWMTHRSDY